MLWRLGILAALLIGLITWENSLSATRSKERAESSLLKILIDEKTRNSLTVAGVRVQTSSGESFLYARSRGIWRLIEPPVNTYAAPGALEKLMQTLVSAKGIVLTNEKHRAKSYGFGGDVAVRITLHGTKLKQAEDKDVLYAIDIGFPVQGTQGSYVRPLGTHEVWSVDQNPRTLLTRPPGSSFPPMLDPNLIPGVEAARYKGLSGIEILPQNGEKFSLRTRAKDPAGVQPGEPSFGWDLVRSDGAPVPCDDIPAMGFSLYLFRATYTKVLGAADVDPDLLQNPDLRMTLTPHVGEPFQLFFGPANRSGSRLVANLATGTVFEISAEVAELMLPTPEQVSDVEEGNPWHDYIQFNPLAGADPLQNPLIPR